MKRSIIKIKDMTFKYDNNIIFDDLNLDIYEGTFTTIVGKNSSGKTTLAKVLTGVLPTGGYIIINGYLLNNYFTTRIRRDFGSVINLDVYFDSVRDNLAFPLENLQYSKKEINVLIDKITKKFKIENILDKSSDEITLSEKVRVLIASSVIYNPKILLLDNILVSLSSEDKELVLKVLKEYQKKHKLTIILLTNTLEDILCSDRVVVLEGGKVLTSGTLSEVFSNDTLEKNNYNLPFIAHLSKNLILYDLLDKVYFTDKEVLDKLWP